MWRYATCCVLCQFVCLQVTVIMCKSETRGWVLLQIASHHTFITLEKCLGVPTSAGRRKICENVLLVDAATNPCHRTVSANKIEMPWWTWMIYLR